MSAKTTDFSSLTKHPSGSLRELWSLSFPLMLSLMSGSLMLFLDRLFLARYSLDALNASSNSSAIAAAVQFAFISTCCIAEVFVGQNNGAGKLHKLGQPVWQMLWLSLLSSLVFLPLAFFGSSLFFQGSPYAALETEFFQWLMIFGPVYCAVSALSAFYIGRGLVKFVMLTVIGANILNVALDVVLIFGWNPWIAPVGAAGAAIATGIAQTFQFFALFLAFIHAKNRRLYGTGKWHFHWHSFMQCLRVGFPNSFAHTLELIAWSCFFRIMIHAGEEYITVISISQSIFFLFTFITEGISKGATAIAANLIGAKKWDLVWKLLWSGIKFYLQVFLCLGFLLALDPEPLIRWFLPEAPSAAINQTVSSACFWVWLFFLFDGINWLVVGLLTAAGDTKFIMKVGSSAVWLFAIIPIYFFVGLWGYSADIAWEITAFYGLIVCVIYLYRFQSERWKEQSLESPLLASAQALPMQ